MPTLREEMLALTGLVSKKQKQAKALWSDPEATASWILLLDRRQSKTGEDFRLEEDFNTLLFPIHSS
jgi:hypothetical protein